MGLLPKSAKGIGRLPSMPWAQAVAAAQALLAQPARQQAMAESGRRFAGAHAGAAQRTVAAVRALLDQQRVDRL